MEATAPSPEVSPQYEDSQSFGHVAIESLPQNAFASTLATAMASVAKDAPMRIAPDLSEPHVNQLDV
jgi:hypothetical protein